VSGVTGVTGGVTGKGKKEEEEVERRRTKMLQKWEEAQGLSGKRRQKKKGQLLGMESNNGTNCVQKVDEETGGREGEREGERWCG